MYRGLCSGFIILIILKTIGGQYINCNGKGFYCQDSTHFFICVDLGTGLTQTVDNIAQQCPQGTFCDNSQIFECMAKISDVAQTTVPTVLETATTSGLAFNAIAPETLLVSTISATMPSTHSTNPSAFDMTPVQPTILSGITAMASTAEDNNSVLPFISGNTPQTVSELLTATVPPITTENMLNLTVENNSISLQIFPLNTTTTQLFNDSPVFSFTTITPGNTTEPFYASLNGTENTTQPFNTSSVFSFTTIPLGNTMEPLYASLNGTENIIQPFNVPPFTTITHEIITSLSNASLNGTENTTQPFNASSVFSFTTITPESITEPFKALLNAIESTTQPFNASSLFSFTTSTPENTTELFQASLKAAENTTQPSSASSVFSFTTIISENITELLKASLNDSENTTQLFNASSVFSFTTITPENPTELFKALLNAAENTTQSLNASSVFSFTKSTPENTTEPFQASLNASENSTKSFISSSFPITGNTTKTDNSTSPPETLNNFTTNFNPAVSFIEKHKKPTSTLLTTETHPNSHKDFSTSTIATDIVSIHALLPSLSILPKTIPLVTPFFVKDNGVCQRPGQYPDENTCHSFYMCHNNVRYKLICPYNMVYSPSLQKCTPLKDHCLNQNRFICDKIGRFPDSKSCYSYFECRKNGPDFTVSRKHCPWFSAYQPNIGQCVDRSGACRCQQTPQTCPHSSQNINYFSQNDERNPLNTLHPYNLNGHVQENIVPVEFDIGYYDRLPGEVERNRGGFNVVDRRWSQPEEESSANDRWIPNYYGSWFNTP